MAARRPAAEVARWRAPTDLWIDHARVVERDLEWMAPARMLTLWNVHLPAGFLAGLPDLRGLSVRGGSGEELAVVEGCERLLGLEVNQINGLRRLSHVPGLRSLEFLSLYGLRRVEELPDLTGLPALQRVELGTMKGLAGLDGVTSLPHLRTLGLVRAVPVRERDVEALVRHPTLEEFEWFAEDVPDKVWVPVQERLSHLRRPRLLRMEDWLAERLANA